LPINGANVPFCISTTNNAVCDTSTSTFHFSS
jgi:hypothetical protein